MKYQKRSLLIVQYSTTLLIFIMEILKQSVSILQYKVTNFDSQFQTVNVFTTSRSAIIKVVCPMLHILLRLVVIFNQFCCYLCNIVVL